MTVTKQTFQDIANSIRAKTGRTAGMKITQMKAEIDSIPAEALASIAVTVTAGGSPLQGATVQASRAGATTLTATTDASGQATLKAVAGYDYTVSASKARHSSDSTTVHLDMSGATAALTLAIYPVLTVVQTGATGTVSCVPAPVSSAGSELVLMPGTAYTLSVSDVAGFVTPAPQTKTMAEGETGTVTFAYVAKPVINIIVTDSESKGGQSGRTIVAANGTDSVSGVTGTDGKVTLVTNGIGAYAITSDAPTGGHVSGASVTVAMGGTYSVPLTLVYGFSGFVGVEIDESESDCATAVTYPQNLTTYDASGLAVGTYANLAYNATPMSGAGGTFSVGSWGSGILLDFIKDIKPVSFDGTTWADLAKTSEDAWPTDRDCFTEFPFRWLSISRSGDKISVVFASGAAAPDTTFTDHAFLSSDGLTRNSVFHLGCYTCSGDVTTNGVFSKKNATNLVVIPLNKYWVGASIRNGQGTTGASYGPYDCLPYAMWTYIQALFLVLYKTRNCQTAHSWGYVGGGTVQSNAGFSSYGNDYGMYGTTANKTTQNGFFWLHNVWGNIYQFSASLFNRAGTVRELYHVKEAMSNASNWGVGWNSTTVDPMSGKGTDLGVNCTGASSGNYIKYVCGVGAAGFAPKSTSGGSSTTCYPDHGYVSCNSSYACFPTLGGSYNYGDNAGVFRCGVNLSSAYSAAYCGTRLAYRGGRS